MTDAAEPEAPAAPGLTSRLVVAIVVGAGLTACAKAGAVPLLAAVATTQALLALGWVYGFAVPGRYGALLIGSAAGAAGDVTVSVWPHSRLGPLLAVFALAVPVMFVHQLWRGAAREHVLDSLGQIAVLVFGEAALPALIQLRHEFHGAPVAATAVAGVVAVAAGGLVIGYLVDAVFAAPRFDADVPRGLLAVLAAAGLGGSLGYLMLRRSAQFVGGRGAFAGAALGVLVALFAVAASFLEHDQTAPESRFGRRIRVVVGVVLPISVLAPVAYLLCLAIRA